MKKIIIHSKKNGTHEVLVDDEDYELISKYKWYVHKPRKNGTLYAKTNIRVSTNKQTLLNMHRLILAAKKNDIVDHKNGNGLDNRKCNIRICDRSGNTKNSSVRSDNKSGYKGVSRVHNSLKYRVTLYLKGNSKYQINGGCFDSKIEAAKKYNELALKYFGEFAKLNPIP